MSSIPVDARAGYRLWAATWDATPSPIVAVEHRTLLPWIAGLQVRCAIDVGCGTGRWTARLGAIGVDASEAMVARAAEKRGLRGRLAVADAGALPVASGVADLVLCALTLGHLADPAPALREFARVLAPDGTLVLSDFHPAAAARGWRRTFRHEGQVYELENHAHTLGQLRAAACELELVDCVEAAIGGDERRLFDAAGRPELYEEACAIPAVLATRWTRR
ncbi:MAG: class I SAM-dependent methyltransferase [Candidatus Solibacter sp.]